MQDLIDKYFKTLEEKDTFKEFVSLKGIIDEKYAKEIVRFKTLESKYNDALSYGKFYPGIDDLRKEFVDAKTVLFSMPEVKRYIDLEHEIDDEINRDFNELKSSISNKFSTKKYVL